MIIGLRGVVVRKDPNVIHIDVNGVIYEVFISLTSYSSLKQENIKIFITHIIREDAQLLYGFIDKSEQIMFERLIKISGVGPKVAMAVCSTFTPLSFATIINNHDINGLKKVPGIGPKSAGRILVELNGFDVVLTADSLDIIATPAIEATLALQSLGFKKEQISKTLKTCTSTDTATLVKEMLQKLQKL